MPQRGRFRSATKKVIENNFSDVVRVKKPVVEIKIEEEKDIQIPPYHDTVDAVSDIVSNVSLTVTEAAGNQNNNMLQFYSDSFTMNANNVVQLISYVGEDTVVGSGFLIVYPEEYIVSSLYCLIPNNKKYTHEHITRIVVHVSPENKTYECTCIGVDYYNGIVLLKFIKDKHYNHYIKWGRGNITNVGEHIFTMNKVGDETIVPFSSGIITHTHYQPNSNIPETLLLSICQNTLSTGQPVFNTSSQVIGMITQQKSNSNICINSSILLNSIKKMHLCYIQNPEKITPVRFYMLGIKYEQVTFSDIVDTGYEIINGIKITSIHKNSNLKKTLKVNDIITHMNDVKIGNGDEHHCLTTLLSLIEKQEDEKSCYVYLTVRIHNQSPIYKTAETIKAKLIMDPKVYAAFYV
ncbi:S1C family serine protease [bacterium]|nr:S1C family serine protease [bacterium]